MIYIHLTELVYLTGRQLYIRFGGEEVEFDPGFHLYLQAHDTYI